MTSTDESRTLESLLRVVRRRWLLIVGCVAFGFVAALGLSVVQQKEYTASSLLLFRDPGFDQQLFNNSVFLPSQDPTTEEPTNLELVSQPVIAWRTGASLRLSGSYVQSAVAVSAVGQANVAQISATDPSPALAARIANTYAQQYIVYRQQSDRAKVMGAYRQVEATLASMSAAQSAGATGRSLEGRAGELLELAALQTGNAEVVQTASSPTSPSAPSKTRNAILGVLLGLLLGLGLALIAERLDRRVRDVGELADAYGVGVLGAVPRSRDLAAHGPEALTGQSAAALGMLRARLRYFNVDRDLRSLLVTSAVAGEGKTTIALNLAIAETLASNAGVVLIEADLRRPVLASRLGINSGPGLAEFLSRGASLRACLRRAHIPGEGRGNGSGPVFRVITAGAVPPNPAELLESRAMTDLLTVLSEQFDLVIVDTPPTSVFPDAIPLMRAVSGVVIVGRIGTTTRDAAQDLREQLSKLGAHALGVIANATSPKAFQYGHYSEYYQRRSATNVLESDSEKSTTAERA